MYYNLLQIISNQHGQHGVHRCFLNPSILAGTLTDEGKDSFSCALFCLC